MRGLAQQEGLHVGTGKCRGRSPEYTEYTFEFSVNTTSYLGIWSASTSYDQASVKLAYDGPQVPQCIGQSELMKVVPDDTVTDLDCRIAAPEVRSPRHDQFGCRCPRGCLPVLAHRLPTAVYESSPCEICIDP